MRNQEYLKLLMLPNGDTIPDPFTVDSKHWIGEKKGKSLWPNVSINEISWFLKDNNPDDIGDRFLN